MKNNTLDLNILVNHIRNQNKPIALCKQLGISNQLLTYYLKQLRLKGIIKKIGKGTWEIVKELPKDGTQKTLSIRNHAYIWKIRFKVKNWDNRINILNQLNIPYKLVGKDKNTPRIVLKGKKIWLTNYGLIIYEPKSFYNDTPLEARKLAVYELQEVIKSITSKLRINLERWEFQIVREHIAKINDLLSIQCNKEGLKLQIIDKGELWMEVDNSFNQDETEFYKTKNISPIVTGSGYQNYYNSHKATNWEVTPTFTLECLNKMTSAIAQTQIQLLEYRKENKKHLALIQEYRKENIAWRKGQVKQIKENLKEGKQKDLLKYFI